MSRIDAVSLICHPEKWSKRNLRALSIKRTPLLIRPSISIPSERFCARTLEKSYFIYKMTCPACRRLWQNLPIYIPISIFVFPKGVNTATILKSLLAYSLGALTIIQPCNSSLTISCKVRLYIFYFFIKFRKNVVLLSTMHSGSGKYHESKKGMRIITTTSPMHLFKLVTWNIKILLVLVSVHTIPDGFRAGTKIIRDRGSVYI